MIKDFLNNEWDVKCVGCSIGCAEMIPPGGIIKETENFCVNQDPEIPIEGFFIIASKKHIKSITELNLDEMLELSTLIYETRNAIKKIGKNEDITIIQEERSGHLHIWLFPRYQWMNEKFDNSISSIRDIMDYARKNLKNQEQIENILKTVEKVKIEINKK